MRPIALLTDFGLTDPYAGQLRAALTRLAPGAAVIDVSHQVEPFATGQAAFFLAASAPHFPDDAVFLCVVDPGVGSPRRLVGASIPTQGGGQDFLAPDSGLLGLLLDTPGLPEARLFDLSGAATDCQATGCQATGQGASATFHGRDIFAPLAARLAAGEDMAGLGSPIKPASLIRQPWAEPREHADGVEAQVLHVDRFGNCVLSLRQGFAFAGGVAGLSVVPGERIPIRLVRTYAELSPGEPGLLAGSQGFYELAANQASAAALLTLRSGDALRILYEKNP